MILSFLKKVAIICPLFTLITLVGCKNDKCRTPRFEKKESFTVAIERLDIEMFRCQSEQEVVDFLNKNAKFASVFLNSDQYPDTETLAKSIFRLINNVYIDTLYTEVQNEFGDMSSLATTLGEAFSNIKAAYPTFYVPKVQTAITGLGRDLYISDSLIIIGLDFFIGPDATYKPNPSEIPGYMLERYTQEYLPAHIINFIAQNYIRSSPADNSMLGEMMDYGKSYFFTSRVLPCMPPRLISGYSSSAYDEIIENEKIIWASFLENEVIYETSHVIKNKFLGERPSIPEIGNECPGRVGRWIGYRIIESYFQTYESATLNEVMKEKDPKKIFLNSRYNPLK